MRCSAQLQGISQRSIRVDYQGNPGRKQTRNPIPVEPKTLGQWLHLKRIEANLTQLDICIRLQIGERRVQAWERDARKPSSDEWKALEPLLLLNSGLPMPSTEQWIT
jgi:hypothetical protein